MPRRQGAGAAERLLNLKGVEAASAVGRCISVLYDEGGPALVTQGFFVTKRWAKAWVRQVGGGKALGADAPCEGLLCEHGHLAPRGPPRLLLPAPTIPTQSPTGCGAASSIRYLRTPTR